MTLTRALFLFCQFHHIQCSIWPKGTLGILCIQQVKKWEFIHGHNYPGPWMPEGFQTRRWKAFNLSWEMLQEKQSGPSEDGETVENEAVLICDQSDRWLICIICYCTRHMCYSQALRTLIQIVSECKGPLYSWSSTDSTNWRQVHTPHYACWLAVWQLVEDL